MGRPALGLVPMTGAERQQRARAKAAAARGLSKVGVTGLRRIIREQERELERLRALVRFRLNEGPVEALELLIINHMEGERVDRLVQGLKMVRLNQTNTERVSTAALTARVPPTGAR